MLRRCFQQNKRQRSRAEERKGCSIFNKCFHLLSAGHLQKGFFYCTKNAMKEKKYFKSKQQELKVNKLFQSHHNDVERERRLSVVVEGENLNKLL